VAWLGHAARLKIIIANPAEGVRQLVGERRQRRLSDDELRHLGQVMREAASEGERPTGLAAIRLMLLTGFRRMEALGGIGSAEGTLHPFSRYQKRCAGPRAWGGRDGLT